MKLTLKKVVKALVPYGIICLYRILAARKPFLYVREACILRFSRVVRISIENFWSGHPPVPEWFFEPVKILFNNRGVECRYVQSYRPHITFFSVFGSSDAIRQSDAQCKIFFTGENTNLEHQKAYRGNCVNLTDLSLGFDFMPGCENYFRFPLWLLYFFRPSDTKDNIVEKLREFKTKYTKTRFCALICSHDRWKGGGLRSVLYKNLETIAPVDSAGNFLHNDDSLKNIFYDDKAKYLQQYKFNICAENSISPGYVTEKIFQSLYSGCAPVYAGWNRDVEPGVINPDIVLFWQAGQDNGDLVREIEKMYKNDALYDAFMRQDYFCPDAADVIYDFLSGYNRRLDDIADRVMRSRGLRDITGKMIHSNSPQTR